MSAMNRRRVVLSATAVIAAPYVARADAPDTVPRSRGGTARTLGCPSSHHRRPGRSLASRRQGPVCRVVERESPRRPDGLSSHDETERSPELPRPAHRPRSLARLLFELHGARPSTVNSGKMDRPSLTGGKAKCRVRVSCPGFVPSSVMQTKHSPGRGGIV